jgi:hypothetical protein
MAPEQCARAKEKMAQAERDPPMGREYGGQKVPAKRWDSKRVEEGAIERQAILKSF